MRFRLGSAALLIFGLVANVGDWKGLVWDAPPATEKQADDIQQRLDGLERTTHDIQKLLVREHAINRERLQREYPLGYSLFYADGRRVETYRFESPSSIAKLDWSRVGVREWKNGRVYVNAPDLFKVDAMGQPLGGYKNSAVGLVLRAGYHTRVPVFQMDDIGVFGEVLAAQDNSLVFVLGVRDGVPLG